ncbi:hypothetical protein GCM10027589_37230 [Actinocorallia lasiicapitis]
MNAYLNVTTATATRAEALLIVRSSVKARLAASGQVAGPITAAWWHEDEYGETEEWTVLLKTTREKRRALEDHLVLHA